MNFGLEKCARICLKRGRVQSKMHIGNTFENESTTCRYVERRTVMQNNQQINVLVVHRYNLQA
jgi:hypothetical protein